MVDSFEYILDSIESISYITYYCFGFKLDNPRARGLQRWLQRVNDEINRSTADQS